MVAAPSFLAPPAARPVGHAHHFLTRLDRVTRVETDLALALYRDPELVRSLLARVSLPDGASRVALSIDDPREGPFVVVTRDGFFVTCLGRGMSPNGLPVVTRERLDAAMARIEDHRFRLALAEERDDASGRLLGHLLHAGPDLSREEFLAATAVAPTLVGTLLKLYVEASKLVAELRSQLVADREMLRDEQALRELLRASWGMAHIAVLVAASADREWIERFAAVDRKTPVSFFSQLTGLHSAAFVQRAAWAAARMGKPLLPNYKARYLSPTDPVMFHDAAWALQTMRLRHAGLSAEITKALGAAPVIKEPLVEKAVAGFRKFHVEVAKQASDGRDECCAALLVSGRRLVLSRGGLAPEGSSYRYAREEDVPDAVAMPAAFAYLFDGGWEVDGFAGIAASLPLVARARAEDFFYPEAFVRATRLGLPLEHARHLVEMQKTHTWKPAPYRADPRPGRNERCSCGSGEEVQEVLRRVAISLEGNRAGATPPPGQ